MERQEVSIFRRIDWQIVLIYLFLVIAGWVNIYSAVYDESMSSILDTSQKYGKQFIWILAAFFIAISILIVDSKLYFSLSYFFYGVVLVLLVAVYLFAPEIKGARSWVDLGWVRFQPSEFAKLTTSLVIARFLGENGVKITRFSDAFRVFLIMILPIALIVLQGDAGSALVFLSFFFVFYREGMPLSMLLIGFGLILVFSLSIVWGSDVISIVSIAVGLLVFYGMFGFQKKQKFSFWVLLLVTLVFVVPIGTYYYLKLEIPTIIVFLFCFAILLVPASVYVYKKKRRYSLLLLFGLCLGSVLVSQSVGYVFTNVLEEHQQKRINVLFGLESDPRGSEFNVIQSKIAIGSGDLTGKGFLSGTQTKNDFVPEQSTDFIFCTIGEEWGFLGSVFIIGLFVWLIIRIMHDAEKQRTEFSRIYGYCVACILFFHFTINIGMTIGLMPVIGIPLPFFSYGGSSLWGFTILLFIFVKLDACRGEKIQ